MEKKSRILKNVKIEEIQRLNFVPGDEVKIELKVKEPIELIINKVIINYE